MNGHYHQEESFEPRPHAGMPDMIEGIEGATNSWHIVKDERGANGNGYVEVFLEASPNRTNGVTHHFKVGYRVTDKPGGTPGKRWEMVNEEDLGPVPKSETIQ